VVLSPDNREEIVYSLFLIYSLFMSEKTFQSLEEMQQKFPAAANYLVTIFVINRDYGTVGNTQLAHRLDVSKPAVNQAINRLKKYGLVIQNPYSSIELTDQGTHYAEHILTKHYLAEYMLITRLNYPWDKADDEASRLQNSFSEDFTRYLYEFFGSPETCPHGNPFPGAVLEEGYIHAPRVDELPENTKAKLIRITEEGEEIEGLLKFCHMHNLRPGAVIQIISRSSDHNLQIQSNSMMITLPVKFARHLCYKEI